MNKTAIMHNVNGKNHLSKIFSGTKFLMISQYFD